MRRRRRRAIVVALDGLGIDLVRAAIGAGKAPSLASLAGQDGPQPVATLPPATPQAAWTTFSTASNPGRHGIFGLTQPGRQLRIRISTADHVRMPTLWERAATDGLSSVVVGLPGTYPARRMSGSLIAGYVVSDPGRLAHPRALGDRLRAAGYRPDVDVTLASRSPDEFAAQLVDSVARRIDVMRSLLDDDRWALAVLAFSELDRWGHAWRRRVERGDPTAVAAGDAMLTAIDRFVGELRAQHPRAHLTILAAHGVAPIERLVNVEAWLADVGYLERTADGALGERTVAFSMEGGRVYVHAARMFAEGRLGGGSVMPVMDEIEAGLGRMRGMDGSAPFEAILRRKDVYRGPHSRVAPHLVCVPSPGWGVASSREPALEAAADHVEGSHRHDLAFVIGAGATAAAPPTLEDLGATVLRHLGLYADDVDGTAVVA